jgi:hypothetical protein
MYDNQVDATERVATWPSPPVMMIAIWRLAFSYRIQYRPEALVEKTPGLISSA